MAEEAERDEAETANAEIPGGSTPEGDALREALGAFERGDYARVRELTRGLVEAKDDEVANYARDLLNRTRVDPVQIGVVVACLALFAYIVYTYVL